jgi:ribosomal protein L11 methyltransferase
VLAALLELAPGGFEQVDGDDFVEFALYGAPGELPAFPEGEAEVGGVKVRVRGEEVAEDWAERWKRFHEPVLVEAEEPAEAAEPVGAASEAAAGAAPAFWVRPPWAASREDALDLVIDPGQAFGTGAHPTTRLCLELLLGLPPEGSLADLGCGSGVLAIAAARLGFGPVTAVDNELAALDATRDNAEANGVRLDHVERVNLREEAPPAADTVVANLMRPLLLEVARRMAARPRALILSGLLDEEADEVAAAFASADGADLPEQARRSAQGWTALLLR